MKTKTRKVLKARKNTGNKRRKVIDTKTANTIDRLVEYYMFGIWNGKA